jgi:RimJ/RimL family protein N-acetyltransferase
MKPDITFFFDEDSDKKNLKVTIETEQLYLCSVEEKDTSNYVTLFGDVEVMEMFGDGKPRTIENTTQKVNTWLHRWETGVPFSAFTVSPKEQDDFIGHVVLGYSDSPGAAELAGSSMKKYWGKGYGKEATQAMVLHYAPEVMARGYTINGQPFKNILATAHIKNVASQKVMEAASMISDKDITNKFSAPRYAYTFDLIPKI